MVGNPESSPQPPPEHRKDVAARNWVERVKTEGKTSEQVVGEFISRGSRMRNIANTPPERWDPKAVTDEGGRKVVFLTGVNVPGTVMGMEAIKAGLESIVVADGSDTLGTRPIYMFPYPRFTGEGEVNWQKSRILMVNDFQISSLEKVVGRTFRSIKSGQPNG